jgi:hypothetical protein
MQFVIVLRTTDYGPRGESSDMILPLPFLIPFLVTAGWGPGPACCSVREREKDSAVLGGFFPNIPLAGESAWLSSPQADALFENCELFGAEVQVDSVAGAHAAFSLWNQELSGDSRSPGLEQSAAPELAASRSSAGWLPATFLEMEDRARDQSVRIPLAGSVFLFGQAEKDNLAPAQASRFVGHTGLTWKLPVQAGFELLLSCGPEVTYTDTLPSDRLQDRPPLPLQTRLLRVDVQCRWRLLRQIGLECQGSVCPALNPGEQDAFHQDLHLAFPLTNSGRFNLGAKYSWDKSTDVKLGPESGQVYGDFRLNW